MNDQLPIEELLRFSYEEAQETWADPVGLSWPDDIEGQARCIRHLTGMATNPAWPYQFRTWAYNKLNELARDYGEKAKQGSVPLEMFSWCFGIVSGRIKPPKRPRGRDAHQNILRDHLIIEHVAWLRKRGETKEAAIEQVAKAVEQVMKATNPQASFGPAAVKFILKKKK